MIRLILTTIKYFECSLLSCFNLRKDAYSLDDVRYNCFNNRHCLTIAVTFKGKRAVCFVFKLHVEGNLGRSSQIMDWPDTVSSVDSFSFVDIIHVIKAWCEFIFLSCKVEAIGDDKSKVRVRMMDVCSLAFLLLVNGQCFFAYYEEVHFCNLEDFLKGSDCSWEKFSEVGCAEYIF